MSFKVVGASAYINAVCDLTTNTGANGAVCDQDPGGRQRTRPADRQLDPKRLRVGSHWLRRTWPQVALSWAITPFQKAGKLLLNRLEISQVL